MKYNVITTQLKPIINPLILRFDLCLVWAKSGGFCVSSVSFNIGAETSWASFARFVTREKKMSLARLTKSLDVPCLTTPNLDEVDMKDVLFLT